METLEGIDVSTIGQGSSVNWADMAAAGIKWAAVKIGEGASFNDPNYQRNLAGARAHGILVMPYWFLSHDVPAAVQAERLLRLMDRAHNKDLLLPAVDIEPDPLSSHVLRNRSGAYGTSWPADHMVKLTDDFLSFVRDGVNGVPGLGKNISIYSYKYWWQTFMGNTHNYAKACPLWDASYPDPLVPPAEPVSWGGWPYWTFWQYTSNGNVAGLHVDRNRYKGSLDDLKKFANY